MRENDWLIVLPRRVISIMNKFFSSYYKVKTNKNTLASTVPDQYSYVVLVVKIYRPRKLEWLKDRFKGKNSEKESRSVDIISKIPMVDSTLSLRNYNSTITI